MLTWKLNNNKNKTIKWLRRDRFGHIWFVWGDLNSIKLIAACGPQLQLEFFFFSSGPYYGKLVTILVRYACVCVLDRVINPLKLQFNDDSHLYLSTTPVSGIHCENCAYNHESTHIQVTCKSLLVYSTSKQQQSFSLKNVSRL